MTAAILIALRTLQPLATNTITAPAGTPRARAGIGDMAWFAGHWTGTGLGGQTEETWSAPAGDAMMGMFRLVRDGKVVFYEAGRAAVRRHHVPPRRAGPGGDLPRDPQPPGRLGSRGSLPADQNAGVRLNCQCHPLPGRSNGRT